MAALPLKTLSMMQYSLTRPTGVASLMARIAQIITDRTFTKVPELVTMLEKRLRSLRKELKGLGDPRTTRLEQQVCPLPAVH